MRYLVFYIIFYILLLLFCLSSCKKEIPEPETFNFKITELSEAFIPSGRLGSCIEFDFDKDSIPELSLCAGFFSSLGGIRQSWYTIRPRDSTQISHDIVIDTVYTCSWPINDTLNAHVVYNSEVDFDCPDNGNTILYKTDTHLIPRIHSSIEELKTPLDYKAESLLISETTTASTTWPYDNRSIIKRFFWSNQEMKYVLFLSNHNGNQKRGWLKISVEGNTSIFLHEVAIEE